MKTKWCSRLTTQTEKWIISGKLDISLEEKL